MLQATTMRIAESTASGTNRASGAAKSRTSIVSAGPFQRPGSRARADVLHRAIAPVAGRPPNTANTFASPARSTRRLIVDRPIRSATTQTPGDPTRRAEQWSEPAMPASNQRWNFGIASGATQAEMPPSGCRLSRRELQRGNDRRPSSTTIANGRTNRGSIKIGPVPRKRPRSSWAKSPSRVHTDARQNAPRTELAARRRNLGSGCSRSARRSRW